MGGDCDSVHLAALGDMLIDDPVGAPIAHMDGLHDNWRNPPGELRHL